MTTANLQDCYLYCRVSGLTQADSAADGLPRQVAAGEAFALREGFRVVQTFQDAYTGTELDRPAFQKMRSMLLEGPVKIVIVENLTRLARMLLVQESIIEDFNRNGWKLISIGEPGLCSDDPGRIAMRQMLGVFSQYEKSMLVSRMRAGKERVRSTGKRCGGRTPYPSPHFPQETEIVNRIHHLKRNGFNLSRIADVLNSDGKRTRKGTNWTTTQVGRILRRKS